MRINFKLLSTFLAVAENASFREAAEQVHLSLPAVSMQIKDLEEQLGVALFHRTTRRVELTREGQQLMISTRKAMAELEGALGQIQQAVDVLQGHLSFACVPTVAGTTLPRLLTDFARRYPGISVRVRELTHPDLVEAVRRREVDFGIGPQPEKEGDLQYQPIFVDGYVALLPASEASANNGEITLHELVKLPLLTLGTSQFQQHLQRVLTEEGLMLDRHYEFTHVSTLIAMAEAGLGVAVLPGIAAPVDGVLKTVRIVRPDMSRTIAVITIRGHSLSPSAARFVEMCDALIPPATSPS